VAGRIHANVGSSTSSVILTPHKKEKATCVPLQNIDSNIGNVDIPLFQREWESCFLHVHLQGQSNEHGHCQEEFGVPKHKED
jgi:hypothetical protein